MWILVRSDLPPGMQIAQAAHAAFKYAAAFPEAFREWQREGPQSLVVLAVENERILRYWLERVQTDLTQPRGASRQWCSVVEPDLDYQLTAIACSPSDAHARLFSNLPLALRERPSRGEE
jgi:hypothetical protein